MVDRTRQAELQKAIESLFFGYRAFTDRPDRILARRGLGRVHHRILYFVGRNPDIAVGGLLDILSISKQALSAPLRQLTEMKLVSLNADSKDRRVRRLALTTDGKALEAELTGTQMKHLAAGFAKAGASAEAGWRRVMHALVAMEK